MADRYADHRELKPGTTMARIADLERRVGVLEHNLELVDQLATRLAGQISAASGQTSS
jgi:hypothetical protein